MSKGVNIKDFYNSIEKNNVTSVEELKENERLRIENEILRENINSKRERKERISAMGDNLLMGFGAWLVAIVIGLIIIKVFL